MKKILYTTCSIALCLLMAWGVGCKPEPKETFGSIYGMVSVAGTADPMRGTGVELYYLNEQGKAGALLLRTTTANDGSYSFEDVKAGEYLLRVEVPGYKRTEYKVMVESGRSARADMQVKPKEDEATDTYYIIETENLMIQKEDLGREDWPTANATCMASRLAGYTDWRLPTINELKIVYAHRKLIGGFGDNRYYWTSSISTDGYCAYVDFSNGTWSWSYSNSSFCIRAVRTITE